MRGCVDLCYVKADRPGIEPATCKSQVRRPTAKPPRSDCYWQQSTLADETVPYALQTAPKATSTGTLLPPQHCIWHNIYMYYHMPQHSSHPLTVTEFHRQRHLQMMTASHSQQDTLLATVTEYHWLCHMEVCMSTAYVKCLRLCLVVGRLQMTSVMTSARVSRMTRATVTSSRCCLHSLPHLYVSVDAAGPVTKQPTNDDYIAQPDNRTGMRHFTNVIEICKSS